MENIQIFNNPDFGEIRTIIIDGEPWFVAKDISEKLGYAKTYNMTKQIDEEDKRIFDSFSQEDANFSPKTRQVGVINESGLYVAIFGSKLESAKKFKKWVTSEVLPSIRKTGSYGQPKSTQEEILLLAKGTAELYERVENVETRIVGLENTMTLDHGQQHYLEKAVNKTVISILGGKGSNAYKQMGRKVFAECNGDLKSYFKVNARGNVPRKRYEEAVAYAENWKPCTNTIMLIEMLNAQQTFGCGAGG